MPVTRSALRFGAVVCTLLIVTTACGSGGTHTQDSASPSGSHSSSIGSSPNAASPAPGWTPPDYGNARPAVDAYLDFEALVDKAFRDPAHVNSSTFGKYLAGQAKLLFDSALADEKKQGKAYRGGAVLHHVRVTANDMTRGALPWAVLRDCQTEDPVNPHVEYYVKTGKPVSLNPASLTPYASTIKIFLIKSQWTITQVNVDTRKACMP